MNHQDVQERFLDYVEGCLPEEEREMVESHLAQCTSCQAHFERYSKVLAVEEMIASETGRTSPSFSVEVMDRIEKNEGSLFEVIIGKLRLPRSIIVPAGAMAVALLAVIVGRGQMDSAKEVVLFDSSPELEREVSKKETPSMNLSTKPRSVLKGFGKSSPLPEVEENSVVSTISKEDPQGLVLEELVESAPVLDSEDEGFLRVAPRDVRKKAKEEDEKRRVVAKTDVAVLQKSEAPKAKRAAEALGRTRSEIISVDRFAQESISAPGAIASGAVVDEMKEEQHADRAVDYARKNRKSLKTASARPQDEVMNSAFSSDSLNASGKVFPRKASVPKGAALVAANSYFQTKRSIAQGRIPPSTSVRIEDFINSFTFEYPNSSATPIGVSYEIAPSPFRRSHYLLKIGLVPKVFGEESTKKRGGGGEMPSFDDVSVQLQFNPELVLKSDVLGYDYLDSEGFRSTASPRIELGTISSTKVVTVMYELVLRNSPSAGQGQLRYQRDKKSLALESMSGEIAFATIRYRNRYGMGHRSDKVQVTKRRLRASFDSASEDFRFAAAVSEFGRLLKEGNYSKFYRFRDIVSIAREAKGRDRGSHRREFIRLVESAESLTQ